MSSAAVMQTVEKEQKKAPGFGPTTGSGKDMARLGTTPHGSGTGGNRDRPDRYGGGDWRHLNVASPAPLWRDGALNPA